ncbi:glycine zipper 2TM domain-containing protein [Arenimonas composti]|uniref:Glycine zipper 2TM domain-containing protein n=1 Tax=Arenimonas composti TR7-09 = DSM 18010 TaxID=1121013 RepID=A0A091BSV1_9GAMM|nr:glycine zipper 2TM domain-containing protein [Arenimonas composti]KFN47400.1 hypothetical protein P873_01795 [Arenimonas composti TR7-09 = DSM 18010]
MNKPIVIAIGAAVLAGGAFAAYTVANPQAEVVSSVPITEKEPVFANVLAAEPVTELRTGTREVCEEVAVERRRPERFGDRDGAVVGAVVGGLIGNQVGGGNGRKLATVAGVVGGAYAGREIDRRHEGGQRYTDYETRCHTVSEPREEIVGYDVRYDLDGQVSLTRTAEQPGAQLQVGERDRIVGYEVTWRYGEQTGTLVMDEDPGRRLPYANGTVLVPARTAVPPAPGS